MTIAPYVLGGDSNWGYQGSANGLECSMSSFPPEVYSRCLLGDYGYPLWTPQLNAELCESYQVEGLKIGDVGILSPKNSSFDVLFNITLQRNEQPYPELVEEDFVPVQLNPQRDLDTQRSAVSPTQGVFPRGSIKVASVQVQSRDQVPARARYGFTLSAGNGAVLVLPEGADKCDLKNERTFLDTAIRHGVSWYEYATDPQKAGRLISNDSLYLVTGFHKARSWSLGATDQNSSGLQNQLPLQFEVGQIQKDSITARAYHWDVVQGFMGCVGPEHPYEIPRYIPSDRRHGVNQTIFIRGFWITINNLFILKTVSVKTPERTYGGLGTYVKNLIWGSPSESMPSTSDQGTTDNEVNQDFQGSRSPLYTDARVTIDRVPEMSETFHPGNSINRYLLKKEPRVAIAVTHDSLWIEMLRTGLLKITDFSRETRLEKVLSKGYQITVKENAVFLQKSRPTSDKPKSRASTRAFLGNRPTPQKAEPKAPFIISLLIKIAQEDALSDKDVFNVVIIGQTGAGVSSLINTITGTSQAPVSTDVNPCTRTFTAYPFTLNGRSFRLIDSPGFGSPKISTSDITKALRELDAQFGVDLIINCLRGSQASASYQNYKEIRSAMSDDVPIVAVITGLERYGGTMGHWWSTNEAGLKAVGMVFVDHACVTTLDASSIHDAVSKDRVLASQKATKQLIVRNCWAEKRGAGGRARRGDMFLKNNCIV